MRLLHPKSNNFQVIAVEEDKVWVIDVTETKRDITTQDPATWGLGTISHRESGSEAYVYDDAAGDSTFGYVVDTGVLLTHEEFEGRAELGYTAFEGDEEDTVGHGTHVSGTIAGKTYGISKKAGIVAVKVFQGSSSSTSIIIEGYEWAVDDIVSKDRQNAAAINLSLGGPASEAFNNAVEAATEQGVITVVAAGNDGADASDYSPASAPSAITVGAVDSDWAIAEFSNYGSVLDIFAPGVDVLSSFIGGDDATDTLSGTSMATPHVVGLVLYALSVDGVKGVDEVVSHLKEAATSDVITGDLKESPNVLGNNGNSEQ